MCIRDRSIVIPLYNESESIVELNSSIINVLSNSNINYEIIYIDDGSKDNSWDKIPSTFLNPLNKPFAAN